MSKQSEIIQWFETDRDYESGKQLYTKYGVNLSFKTTFNRSVKTDYLYKTLCYELSKIAGLSEAGYKQKLQKPLTAVIKEKIKVDVNTMMPEDIFNKLIEVDINDLSLANIQAVAKLTGIKPAGKKKSDLFDVIVQFKKNLVINSVPEKIKRVIRLREDFPFLKSKECPSILKELVNDMITDYENYVEGHEKLKEETDPDLIAALSKSVVEDYLENRQIWAELAHYKQTGEFKAEHPLFAWIERKNKIQALSTSELVKLKDQLENNIPRNKKKIADDPEHKETNKRQARVDQFEKELTLVKQLLNL